MFGLSWATVYFTSRIIYVAILKRILNYTREDSRRNIFGELLTVGCEDRSHRIHRQCSVIPYIRHACTRTHVRTSNFNVPRHGQCNHVVCLPVLSFGHRRWAYSRLQSRPGAPFDSVLQFVTDEVSSNFRLTRVKRSGTRWTNVRPVDLHIEVPVDGCTVDNCKVFNCWEAKLLVFGFCLNDTF